ncbi:hypothetical protein [Flavobacterium sp. ACAM 123]|uniref:hypothetical protein n=1 Tax=Flavobacterium sp. ACAM 123 TaxID=1189620 RepID=UPI0002EB1442|nr:hypothetical protein [Flavobacterium sp. ACAM 123]
MLHKSGINLFSSTSDFFNNEELVILFSAYIKTDIIKQLNSNHNIKQIIVRWEIEDLVKGVSDIDLYLYCKDNNIQLFRNTRIHLKTAWNFDCKILFGSANYTNRGVGESNNYNYELSGTNENISFSDKIYLNTIIKSSRIVDDNYYNQLKKIVDSVEKTPKNVYPELEENIIETNSFLLSELPMSLSPDDLYDVAIRSEDYDSLNHNCAAHDIALYQIDVFQDYSSFKLQLKDNFNFHPFILALKDHIKAQSSKSLNYGRIVQWIRENTTTVPTPRSWEIKEQQIVNILYTWICCLDEEYTWDVPGNRSEVIYYYGK